MRFLLTLMIIGLIFWAISKLAGFALRKWLVRTFTPPTSPSTSSEKLVQCATCQTFLPLSKAIQGKGLYYCCQDHANL